MEKNDNSNPPLLILHLPLLIDLLAARPPALQPVSSCRPVSNKRKTFHPATPARKNATNSLTFYAFSRHPKGKLFCTLKYTQKSWKTHNFLDLKRHMKRYQVQVIFENISRRQNHVLPEVRPCHCTATSQTHVLCWQVISEVSFRRHIRVNGP